MTIRQIQLIPPTTLTTAAVAYLTAPSNTTYRIGRAGFCNTTGGAVTITANVVPTAGSPSTSNEVINAINVPANSTYISPELAGLVLQAGSSLQVLASAASSINLYASGTSIQ